MKQTIVDRDGEWFQNLGSFPFVNPLNGVRFEPGEQVQVKPDEWTASQPVLVKVKSPEEVAAENAAAEEAAAKVVEAEAKAAKAAAKAVAAAPAP